MNGAAVLTLRRVALGAGLAAAALCAPAAHAGLFDDDEARKAILELRQKLEQSNEAARARQTEQMDQMAEQIGQLKRSLLDLNTQLELLRADSARLRGQDEQLARDVAELQRAQKDTLAGLDGRLRKMEPQKIVVDDKEFTVDPDERRQYDDALAVLRKGDFDKASAALSAFRSRYPGSGYTESVLFWLGNAQYGKRDYKDAMAAFRSLVAMSPTHAKAPEALLSLANCQLELKDTKGARRTIEELMKNYPASEAAQAGKERLASIK